MQKPKSAKTYCHRNKLYVNRSGLTVCGESVRLLENSRSATRTRSSHATSPKEAEEKQHVIRASVKPQNLRSEATLNIAVYNSEEIRNEKLKRISEAIEIEKEFRRFLDTLGGRNSKNTDANSQRDSKILKQTYAGVYEEFFGVYYRQLKELIAKHNK